MRNARAVPGENSNIAAATSPVPDSPSNLNKLNYLSPCDTKSSFTWKATGALMPV